MVILSGEVIYNKIEQGLIYIPVDFCHQGCKIINLG